MRNIKGSFQFDHIFPIPVLTVRWENVEPLNNQLRELILNEMKVDAGHRRNNKGGWSSKNSLFEQNIPVVLEFKEMIKEAIQEMLHQVQETGTEKQKEGWEIQVWGNVSRENYLHKAHDHLGAKNPASWSGVYYLDTGSIDEHTTGRGFTTFENRNFSSIGHVVNGSPRWVNQNGMLSPREEKILPEVGKMMVFPASLWHRVESYTGQEKRITIAFNVRHKEFGTYVFTKEEGASAFKFWMWLNFRGLMRAGVALKKFLMR